MFRLTFSLGAGAVLALSSHAIQADTPQAAALAKLPGSLVSEIESMQESWGEHPAIVSAVKQHNARNIALSDIKQLDEQWKATSGLAGFMMPFFDNSGADALGELESDAEYVLESFIMGNQGGLVAATNKTSDYWQGDEAKFTESYANGQGQLHLGDIEFDESAQAYLIQVSVPVMSEGAAIGAITIGVNIDEFE